MSTKVYMPKTRLAIQIVPKLHERLRRERERLGHSQDEFGRLLGITRVTQNYYENGSREPGLSYLSAFAQNGGDLLYLLLADEHPREYVDLIDWDLFAKVWIWVQRVARDKNGNPYPPDLQVKIFRLAYQACRIGNSANPEKIDLTVLLGSAA